MLQHKIDMKYGTSTLLQ